MAEPNEKCNPRLYQLYDELGVAVIVISLVDDMLLYSNQRVCDDLGLSRECLCSSTYKQIFWPEFMDDYESLLARCSDGEEHTMVYYWAERLIWEQIAARRIIWENNQPAILLTICNISEVARKEYQYQRMALFDSLLGLPNGQKLEEDINQLADPRSVALLYFEVERFEDINELYGWEVGDHLLRAIKDWLLSSEIRRAQLYRINNGFALLGREVNLRHARERAQQILGRFTRPWAAPTLDSGELSIFCTIKLGIVFGKYVKNEMRNLLLRTMRAADHQAGYAVYDEHTDRAAKQLQSLRQTLIHCVFNSMAGFRVNYQPIVQAVNLRWVGLEALCRWRTPSGQEVDHAKVIHLAEQLGLIGHVDDWVRQTAMNDCVALGLHEKDFFLDVNFSPEQKLDGVFADNLLATLKRAGFPAGKLNLEITESGQMHFSDENLRVISLLKDNGIALSLDDFGTGYSSLENLIKISASTLKTEKMFIDDIENDGYRQYLLEVLVKMAHHLNMKLVAEGVETLSQVRLLQQYGVDYMQGYFFSRPLALDLLRKKLTRFS